MKFFIEGTNIPILILVVVIFNKHFSTTAQRLLNFKPKAENILHDLIDGLPQQHNSFNITKVTKGNQKSAILNLCNDSSTVPDNIPSKYLKLCVDEIISQLCHIINESIEKQTFPEQLKFSKINPIPKINQPIQPSDYRPISILPILSEVYEKVLLTQLNQRMENNQLLSTHQSGFQKSHCTISTWQDNIVKAMNRGKITLAVMTDFSKSFDTVDFETLIWKLHKLNLSKSSLRIFASYSNRHQYIQIGDSVSQRLAVINGVPQGSIVGPVLFNIYVDVMNTKTQAAC